MALTATWSSLPCSKGTTRTCRKWGYISTEPHQKVGTYGRHPDHVGLRTSPRASPNATCSSLLCNKGTTRACRTRWYISTDPRQKIISKLVLWAQSTTMDYIRAKTNFSLSPIYSAHKSSNHKYSKSIKSVPTQIYIKQNIHKHQFIYKTSEEWVPSVLPLLKKAHKDRIPTYGQHPNIYISASQPGADSNIFIVVMQQWNHKNTPYITAVSYTHLTLPTMPDV